MRLAVISDMHGNGHATRAVLAEIDRESVDAIICLGDAVQGGPEPAEIVAILREREIRTIMGNADAWMLSGHEIKSESLTTDQLQRLNKAREWSLSQLSQRDREFIAAFEPTFEIDFGACKKLLCFHGSPASYDELLFPDSPDELFTSTLGSYDNSSFCGGHTHAQFVRRFDQGLFFNPGSVGVVYRYRHPANGIKLDPWAEYAILTTDGERQSLDFRRVPIDVAELLAVYRQRGHPSAESVEAEYSAA